MTDQKIVDFIKTLSKDTLSNRISWKSACDYQNVAFDPDNSLSILFQENEFRHIDFLTSYYAVMNLGIVIVLSEENESGRDGILTSGYKIYLHDASNGVTSNLRCADSLSYQLVNSIQVYLANAESAAESFIDKYLSNDAAPYSHQ